MKTIAIFHPSSELYGADRILVNAIKCFPEDYKKIVYLKTNGPLVKYIEENTKNTEVKIHQNLPIIYRAIYSPLGLLKFVFHWLQYFAIIKKECRKNQIDFAYVNTLSCVFILPILYYLKIKNFIHIHEIIENPKIIAKTTAHLSSKFSSKIICVSEAVEENIIRLAKNTKYKSEVVHNGIDKIKIGPPLAQNGMTKFYLFGRISQNKGHWFLLDALSLIPRNLHPKIQIVMMGGCAPGKEKDLEDLKDAIKAHKLSHLILIKKFDKKINGAMTEADICLVPSQMKDPFPTTVLEAMSAGKAVIATNHGGAKEVLIDNQNGMLVNPENPQELADKMTELILNNKLIHLMGLRAQKTFELNFTLEHFNKRWNNSLKDIIYKDAKNPKLGILTDILGNSQTKKTAYTQ